MKLKWVLLGIFFTQTASAHTFGALDAGLTEGFIHPLLGLDHLLAMLAVGLWAQQLGGRPVWLLPAGFITIMSGSALLGASGFELPLLEPAIAASVLVLGLLLAFAVRLSMLSSLSLIGLFAVFHGFAHGLELPETQSAALYGLGFVTATALLHGLGVLLGYKMAWLSKASGFIIAASGAYLLAF